MSHDVRSRSARDAIASVVLGPIQVLVSDGDERTSFGLVLGCNSDPDARRDRDGVTDVRPGVIGDRSAESVHPLDPFVAADVRQEQQELLATHPRGQATLHVVRRVLKKAGDLAQHLVTGSVGPGVVDALEVVQVDQGDGQLGLAITEVLQELGELFVHVPSVVQSRERVANGQLPEEVAAAPCLGRLEDGVERARTAVAFERSQVDVCEVEGTERLEGLAEAASSGMELGLLAHGFDPAAGQSVLLDEAAGPVE